MPRDDTGHRPDEATRIGVVVVSYGAAEAVVGCLESLRAAAARARADGAPLRVLVVDNASPDDTVETLRLWAARTGAALPEFDDPETASANVPDLETGVGLLHSGANRGFAGGVNLGLHAFAARPDVDAFWVLNPDTRVPEATPGALGRAARAAQGAGGYAVITGRLYFADPPDAIQNDGGRVSLTTGRVETVNVLARGTDTPGPAPGSLDFAAGAHMLVSRAMIETAGYMPEDYFLYYEEIDWCLRRGDLPILWVADAPVVHDGGASIGSANIASGPSALSAYWTARSRMRFVRRWRPWALPFAAAFTLGKAAQQWRRGNRAAARAALRGLSGRGPN